MKVGELNGFEFHLPLSGGKAGKGHNKTSTVQVRRNDGIVRQFRFTTDDKASMKAACAKAKAFAMGGAHQSPPHPTAQSG